LGGKRHLSIPGGKECIYLRKGGDLPGKEGEGLFACSYLNEDFDINESGERKVFGYELEESKGRFALSLEKKKRKKLGREAPHG